MGMYNFINSNSAFNKISSNLSKTFQKENVKKASKDIAKKTALVGAGVYATRDMYERYRTGGTITRNKKNERDIVGIPFL